MASLPDVPAEIGELFLDVETTGLSPFMGDRICGVAVAFDGGPSHYVPVRHEGGGNVDLEQTRRWLAEILSRTTSLVNHNVKFDAHFLRAEGLELPSRLVCTLALAKTIDSDRMSHGLKELARDWLRRPTEEQSRVQAWMKDAKTKSFAAVPADILGPYARADVEMTRDLWAYVRDARPEDMAGLWNTEIAFTSVLQRMEEVGILVDRKAAVRSGIQCMLATTMAADEVKELTGIELVDSAACIGKILLGHCGMPVLSRSEKGNPSFDADALEQYEAAADTDEQRRLVGLIKTYRDREHFKGLFVDALIDKADKTGRVHPSYNQTVRTGRMSCSDPNSQQMSPEAKELLIPGEGRAFLCLDASQVEFRIIVHYSQDEEAIEAYRTDPRTDYHQWVADQCGIERTPAKTLNFAMGYGAGKAKVRSMLQAPWKDKKGVEHRGKTPEESAEIYRVYHERFPSIRRVSERAALLCRQRGYIRNLYGRRRHLPPAVAHKAFNSLVQGCAMDMIKERMVAVEPVARRLGLRMLANVHDELLFDAPAEALTTEAVDEIRRTLETVPDVGFRVPFVWDAGTSAKSWREAKP